MTAPSPVQVCAEYLALTITRREGYAPADADRLAHLTGLPVMDAARLTRVRDLGEFRRRRDYLNAVTTTTRGTTA